MRTKNGVLRIVEVWDGESFRPWCMCYKNTVVDNVRRFNPSGVVKYRYRLSGRPTWHVDFA